MMRETNLLKEIRWFTPAARGPVIDDGSSFPFFVAILEDFWLR
jgi:hypothetical protein